MSETATHRKNFRFFHRLRVRWAEVDMQKIVFNAHYLMYFDTAISDYWRALALPYEESMHSLAGDLYVRKATIDFRASARMDDMLDVGMRCARIGNSSMVFEGGLFRQDQFLVGCELVYVFADPATQTSKPVPEKLRSLLAGYEAGEPMRTVETGDWATLGESAGALRRAVFVEEQNIPESLEWDEHDAKVLHAVARNRLGQVIATGRLLHAEDGVSHIGRMAVHRNLRSGGHGAAVMQALEEAARARGDRVVALNAQRSAERFYARLGYVSHGDGFEEAGIPHIEMRRTLG
ncbi:MULTISPECIES: YbgC/FadM family acyl-CoA thioesterase [Variovorax]|jgi:YbgC/YbaW family acyl-CoA thioester hydrolase|uniref:YbgC/FadM family acyl-CoA thioesterase n=1 Tax=Variovorax TaxID=34072 RepID=UPI00086ACD76|nr:MULTISPECIES: YbgC/FadM family acyl-CoA thioesterase [Variovorax]MBN8751835.1 YbgC/FadM family acyl-CoA thioesterase [Variovorax sp.]ODU17662.1 MAG: 4-hydroxybenzoyl-CoA thioesterase [Variovorax sp. SCN 67-85]ODV27020.1 MAG: 4-hydroxybenzoyl-CoA thioesterase [Variovorax sp. SCN 67-20]OJZ09325.1 MAG: 4-hydroxybenzoyl-CoA thioesterase [Variovorax sp. 67-131]UKI04907.1 YbgC/FadM family acyl-CoA thioesterase [Variovorax paradoxus]